MVRETRHLWVGNLPENIREDRIRDHFKRYGRVQSVKLLPRAKDDEGTGVCATVSFMDIKSASKAHNNEQKLEDRTLTTEYHEPAAIPGSAAPIYSSQRFSHGPPEEINSFERSSHFYERERDRRDGDAYLRRASSTYHVTAAEPLRGRTRDRHYRNGPYAPIIESVVSRQPPHHRSVGSNWSYDSSSRYPPPATTPDVYGDDRRDLTPVVVVHKKHTKSRSGSNGSESGSNSSSVSRSRSSSSSSQSGSSSCSSASSSPTSDKSCSTHSHHGSLRSGVTLQSAVSTPHTNNSSPAVHSDDRRPLAICVRNLPARSSDTSLKDGLFHEYKKHGKVTWVKVVGQGSDRYALVCFKKPDDVEKALLVSHDKLFFGCKIEVAAYQGYDVDDNEFRFVARPYEAEQDEFHPKATRTLFIGNLEKDITAAELRKHFDQFGEIIEIDIKKQGSNSSYAFCQYCDISSVVRAMRTLDGEHLGNNRIKLGFGKSLHTNCVWVDGVAESVTEKYLSLQFSQFGPVSHVAIDRSRGHALVFYDQIGFAQSAVKEMRGVAVRGRKLQVDFASRECQEAFYDHLEKQTGHNTTFDNSVQVSPQAAAGGSVRGFETPSSSSSSSGGGGGGSSRYPRYSTQPPVTRTYTRGTPNNVVSPGTSPSTPARSTPRHVTTTPRFDFNSDFMPDRRPYRSYEEMSLEDGGGTVTVTVGQGPQDIRHLQKERVALLEQLEDCASSGEEGSSRRRCKHRRSHSGEGSRPGTPLCDERPENLPPVEPRRTPRERPPDPLSLPLPRFATQLMSPRPAPRSPPASPPRPHSTSSDDSEPSPPSPEWEERLRSLDEKYEKWSGSRSVMTKVDPTTLRVRHKLLDLDLNELQPSEIVKSVLAKRSVFDEDSKRLENFGEKYEPREFVPTRPGFSALRPRTDSPLLHSPAAPKSPAAASSPAGAKGLQYPFPSHPPVQPTTSVATTTAPMSLGSSSSLSSSVTTVSSIVPSGESSKSQTFPTTCVSTVSSVRQFQLPNSTFHQPPKMSSPPSVEKKLENVDPRLCREDKMKAPPKLITPNVSNNDKSEVSMKEPSLPSSSLKPLKSCLRRESADDRVYDSVRRMSRDEDGKVSKTDCEKMRDTESFERRRSYSDPRRRDSVDSNKDSLRTESVSDKLKDRNHKEERRRRDSVDNSAKKDTEISEPFKSRLSDSRVSEHSDLSDCSKSDSLNPNKNFDTRHDDNTRHTTIDTSEKKKDSIQICPERDRRRGRESLDNSSDSSRIRKVPESLDVKKELECDTRQKDNGSDKNDPNVKKSIEYTEKKKESGQQESQKSNESLERRKDKDIVNVCQENVRHKEKREQSKSEKEGGDFSDNTRHKSSRKSIDSLETLRQKDDRLKSSFLENSRHKENTHRRESESSEDLPHKGSDIKKEVDNQQSNKFKESSHIKEHFSDLFHSVSRSEESNDIFRIKELRKDQETNVNARHRENSKHFDYTRLREDEKKRDNGDSQLVHSDLKKDHSDSTKQKYHELDKDAEITRHLKQSNSDYSSHRFKEYDKRKDVEKLDFRTKNSEKPLQNDIFENTKQKNYEKQNNTDPTSQISEWVEEIRKDLENSGYCKSRDSDDFDTIVYEKRNSDASHSYENLQRNEDKRKEEDCKSKLGIKKEEESENLHKESEKKKFNNSSDYKFYERRKNADTAEIFRRKELARKKESFNDIDSVKLKDIEKKLENDFFGSLVKQRNIGDKKRESCDQDRHKETIDHINDINHHRDWYDDKHMDRKPELEKGRRTNKEIDPFDKESESDSYDKKEDPETYEKKENSFDHHDEDIIRKSDFSKKEKKRENLWPAAIGSKRRLSSQDSLDINADDSKKSKPERRDSKDSGRSSTSSKKSTSEKHNKSFAKLLEEKIKEDKEKEQSKKRKDEEIENLKNLKKDKKSSGEKRKEERSKSKQRHKENGITASESEAGSGDDDSKTPKRHSIFDIVDEEPAYISMYDKVKARSTKNMQKQEEEKRQERLKEKFNQLKQSRAKREEKKRSTSYDEDSDSERGGRRSNKLMITSSEEDGGSEGDMRSKGRKIMSDTSEDDSQRHPNLPRIKPFKSSADEIEMKPRKIMSDTSEDDTRRLNIARIKVPQAHQEDLEPKLRKILSDTSEDDIMKHSISKNKPSRIQSDESEIDLSYDEQKKNDGYVKKTNNYPTADLFSNISEDPEHPTQTDIEKEQSEQYHRNSIDSNTSDLPRKKSHKKKQKRQKNSDDEGSSKRHNSKKDRRKSSHSHDGDEDQIEKSKVRKKKSERDSSSKRDEKMEDIFGPLSDDSDKTHNKWHVSQIYGSDSEDERQIIRKRDKRRKERKARELDEAGRALEAKLLENADGFPPSEDFKEKVKKKKRKKSREEKMSKHHQQRLEEEAAALANEADSEREPEPPLPPQSLPRLMDSPPPPPINQNKKPDIPGFGSQVDENIHETAVKSISESPTKPIEDKREPIEEPIPSANTEDKPTPVISQEETEDAVAALLLEDSFGGGFESYTKPDTPVSEPDLQIDTDTEDNYDPIDFSRPPRTPDIPTSFYRQQDTREGLEERILALACPDNSKQDSGQSPASSPPTVHINDYHHSDNENKSSDDKDKEERTISYTHKSVSNETKAKPDDISISSKEQRVTPTLPVEAVKRPDLPPLISKEETYLPSKTSFVTESSSQITGEQKTDSKVLNVEKPPLSTPQIVSKVSPVTLPPPLVHTTNQLSKSISSEKTSVIFTSPPSVQTETTKNAQSAHSQLNHQVMFSTQVDINKSKPLHTQSTLQESTGDKSPLTQKPVSQIIVTPPTSVALIVQTQSKLPQSSQPNNSVLQLATKLHSPSGQPVDSKGSTQVPHYVLHPNLQSPQALSSQSSSNKTGSQPGSISQGSFPQLQGNHKLTLPATPVSAKSPGLTIPPKPIPDQYKQIIVNQPHNQQLSVNVSHSQHMNANILLSPSQQLNINHSSVHHSPSPHHSPATLSFSPHPVKVSIAQQQTNNIHPNLVQLSPNIHHQQVSPHQQKPMQQHSPIPPQSNIGQHVSPGQHATKNNTTLLQQVPNCIPVKLCSPTKSGTCHTIRHLSPVSQPNSMNKMNAHVLQTSCVQQVRAVVLQNPTKQTVTLLQPQIVQKAIGAQMIRPLNAPQPQVVHTLKNDTPVLDKNRPSPENIQGPHLVKNEASVLTTKSFSKSIEEPLSLTTPKRDELQNPVKLDKAMPGESVIETAQPVSVESKIIKPQSTDDVKPLNAVIQDLTCKISSSSTQQQDTKMSISTTLDKVVQELHDRKKAAESKEPVKVENNTEEAKQKLEETPKISTDAEIKKEPESCNEEQGKRNEIKSISVETINSEPKVEPKVEEPTKLEPENPTVKSEGSSEKVFSKPLDEPKIEKIRIKKEENGLCIETSSSSSNANSEKEKVDVQDEIKEDPKDELMKNTVENVPDALDSKEIKETQGVGVTRTEVASNRGRGGRRRKASGRGGGVVTRRARLNNNAASASETSADVYEFRDDSEEEANRPRLILTIKSPTDTPTTTATPTAPTATVPAPVPTPATTTPAQNNNTRKSRRLQVSTQEKDGVSRTTVDDTIEDVIRGTRTGGRRTTRASANCAASAVAAQALETRKSPRRKQCSAPPLPVLEPPAAEVKTEVVAAPAESAVPAKPLTPPSLPTAPQTPAQPPSTEPMTLIDPVTGLLIPMRESEEGQYIPVNTDHVRPLMENKEDSGEPAEKRMRTALPTESENSLPTRPGIPVKVPPNCAVVPPLPPKTTPKPIVSDLSRPIIAHGKPPVVAKTTGIVVPSGIPRPTSTLPSSVSLSKPLTIAAPSLVKPPQGVMMSPTGINNKASVTNVVGPMTINRVVAPPPLSPSAKVVATTPLSHKTHLLQAVQRQKVPVAGKVPTPMTPKAHILHSINNVEGMVGAGTPPPPHHGPLLTGSVASPPLRAHSQQPVVTGASSARVVCKGGLLEPLKVEPGGCIVVPTASPQSRSQVMQAGLPVPAYEASMGDVVQHVNFPPHHIQPAHYVHPQLVYQQYLREAALTGYHLPAGVKGEIEEGAREALELRRGSPHDRTTDSPQVATVYVHGPRHLYYDPPPAHRPSHAQPRLQVATPPHASQVPPQADSLLMLLQRYPVMWQGLLALKTDQAAVQMHFVFGNPNVARDSLPCNSDGSTPPLRIAQRMRLEQTQVEGVARKMQMDAEHCMLLALPCGRDHMDVLQQSNNLQSGFITYLQQKQAAGIVNIAGPGSQQAAYVVHIFPSCDFANESLARIAPDLLHRVANIAHLLIVIATV